MDLRKVKTVLILLFAVLNVILLTLLIRSFSTGRIDALVLKNAKVALTNNGVELKCPIPAANPEIGIPEFADTSYDTSAMSDLIKQLGPNSGITFNDDNSIVIYNIPDEKISEIIKPAELDKYIAALLARFKINMSGFVQDSSITYENGKQNLNYILKLAKDIYSYDCTAEMVISDTGIEYLKIKHLELVRTYDISPIIPAYQILMKNYNKGGTIINKIDLGFITYRLTGESKNPSYTPVWRIISADGDEVSYYRAYTGEQIFIYQAY